MSHRLCLRQLTLLLGLFLCSVPSSRAAPLLGVFVGDPYNNTAGGLPNGRTQYDEFVAAMGRTPVLIDTYVEGGSGANVVANLQQMVTDAAYSANGIRDANTRWPARLTPVIGIPMAMSHETAEQGFQAIASGARDVIYRQVLLRYINDGFKTIYVRPGWEMNGTWNPWSVTPANVTGWVKAWQHLVTNMRDYARTNGLTLKVMWNPGYGKYTDLPYLSLWPGDAYVDIVAIDHYGEEGGSSNDSPYDMSTDAARYTLHASLNLAISKNKPWCGGEIGAGTHNAAFPTNFADVVSNSGATVACVIIWNDPSGCSKASCYWSNTPATAAAWKAAFARIAATAAHRSGPPGSAEQPPVDNSLSR
jgi:hypothetical protein